MVLETFDGRCQVEWKEGGGSTAFGQLPFFIEFLKIAELFEPWVNECPIAYRSPNAPLVRDLLGTLFLSILAGHRRYAHTASIRSDDVCPKLLGMTKVVSEDSLRRGLSHIDKTQSDGWLGHHLRRSYEPLLAEPWILDIDTTVKLLYGHQEGAVKGYNPTKPGRPSHSYHTYWIAHARLALDVDVYPGNLTASKYTQPGLWKLIDSLPVLSRPYLVRGDCNFGNESMMMEAEKRGQHYLFKLRQTQNVKVLTKRLFRDEAWLNVGQGWHAVEGTLELNGWSKTRRVVMMRRRVRNDIALVSKDKNLFLFAQTHEASLDGYEYAVLVTSCNEDLATLAQLYRDRADIENTFDELKNQWGWGGFMTQDLARCTMVAKTTALIYNWWSLFVRLAIPDKHAEAITSRPLLLHGIGKLTHHQNQTKISIISTHAKSKKVQVIFTQIKNFMHSIQHAEQLSWNDKWRRILSRIFIVILKGKQLFTQQLALAPP